MSGRVLVTLPWICAEVGVSRWTWRRWVRDGRAPRAVPGLPGHPRWKREDVERFMDGRVSAGRNFFSSARRELHARSVREVRGHA